MASTQQSGNGVAVPVSITVEGGRITEVFPETVELSRARGETCIEWQVIPALPAGFAIEIDFHYHNNLKGPFRRGHHPRRGRFSFTSTFVSPETDRRPVSRGWKYDVTLLENGDERDRVDPMIEIVN